MGKVVKGVVKQINAFSGSFSSAFSKIVTSTKGHGHK